MQYRIAVALLVFIAAVPAAFAQADAPDKAAQTALHILDYVSVDYPGVVQGGVVQNPDEYQEQQEFIAQLLKIAQHLPENGHKADIRAQAEALAAAVDAKAAGDRIGALTRQMSDALIAAYGIKTAPESAPALADAKRLFMENCSACHGAEGFGDGPRAAALDPHPANFHDRARQSQRSIYGLYSTIGLGVLGTAMPSFSDNLSEAQRWALAFYVSDFSATSEEKLRGADLWQQGRLRQAFPDLGAVTAATPREIEAKYGDDGRAVLAYLRASPEASSANASRNALNIALTKLSESAKIYRDGQPQAAYETALAAYLQGFELMETSLRITDPELRETIERRMSAYRANIQKHVAVEDITRQAEEIEALLHQAGERVGQGFLSPLTGAFSAFLLLLREGVEAILVLAAIVSLLIKTERREQLTYVHAGWIGALLLGVITWLAASEVISISGANREVTEGLTALIAAVMLIYVGYWLHTNANAKRWKSFIHDKLDGAKQSIWPLVAISFLAVYREVFETILFFETLWLQVAESQRFYLIGGLAVAIVALLLLAWGVFRFSVRLPVRAFFQANAVLLYGLAVIFTGKGIAALQEAGKLPLSPINIPTIDILGIYPALEGLAMQGILIAVAVAWLVYKRAHTAA